MHRLVLLRHGESDWNRENRFTGWTDVDLSAHGVEEARTAGRLLKAEGMSFDLAFTSVLERAIRTLWLVLEEMDLLWIPEDKDWRLNERHYGALQGLNKAETAAKFGEAQVQDLAAQLRHAAARARGGDPRDAARDARYRHLTRDQSRSPNALQTRSRACCLAGTTRSRPRFAAGSACWSRRTAIRCERW